MNLDRHLRGVAQVESEHLQIISITKGGPVATATWVYRKHLIVVAILSQKRRIPRDGSGLVSIFASYFHHEGWPGFGSWPVVRSRNQEPSELRWNTSLLDQTSDDDQMLPVDPGCEATRATRVCPVSGRLVGQAVPEFLGTHAGRLPSSIIDRNFVSQPMLT